MICARRAAREPRPSGHSVAIADGSKTNVARAREPGLGRNRAGPFPRKLRRAIMLRATALMQPGWLERNEHRTGVSSRLTQIRG